MIEKIYMTAYEALLKFERWRSPPKLEVEDIVTQLMTPKTVQTCSEKIMGQWPWINQAPPQPVDGRVLVDEIVAFSTPTPTLRLPTAWELHSAAITADFQLYIMRHKAWADLKSLLPHFTLGPPTRESVFSAVKALLTPSSRTINCVGALAFGTLWTVMMYYGLKHHFYCRAQKMIGGTVTTDTALPGQFPRIQVIPAAEHFDDQVEDALNGDLSLYNKIRLLAKSRLMEWALWERKKIAEDTNYGKSLYHQQQRLRRVFGRVDYGEDFLHGCLSTLGDHRTLSPGELYIQLNRHLNGYIKAMQDRPNQPPLTTQEIQDLRAAMDIACGDHVQVQVSR